MPTQTTTVTSACATGAVTTVTTTEASPDPAKAEQPAEAKPKVKTFYTMSGVVNPIIAELAAAELGVDISNKREIDVMGMENRAPEMLAKNPGGGVPFVELETGEFIAETMAIAELFEECENNGTTLLGKTAAERGNTRQWHRRVEQNIAIPLMNAFRWGGPFQDFFANRGPHGVPLNSSTPEQANVSAAQQMAVAKDQLKWLNGQMGDKTFICGDQYTMADVTLYAMLWFFSVNPGFGPPFPELVDEGLPLVWAWYSRCEARAATKACGAAEGGPLKK